MDNQPRGTTDKEYEARKKLRMTNWEDLTADQKVERMREIIKNLQNTNRRMYQTLSRVEAGFEKHSHLEGKIVVDYNNRGYGDSGIGEATQKGAENYF